MSDVTLPKVFFAPVKSINDTAEVQKQSRKVLQKILQDEPITLQTELPLKLHFGERGNFSFLKPELYDGIIDELEVRGVHAKFTETSVLYGGERFDRERHTKLAHDHGFWRLPIQIADGAHGEEAIDVPVNGKHFKTAAIARILAEAPQTLVVAHFKGHMLAGFGGAIKQLSMGFAAKGGKMAMHTGVKPRIINRKCHHCKQCLKRCHAGAITIGETRSFIDHNKCIGCGACFSICPFHAVSIWSWAGLKNTLFGGRDFREKLVEYALASHRNKQNIYLNFALNITRGCDCEPRPMHKCVDDIGIFGSLDPVAIDSACYQAVARQGKKFRGVEQLAYAEKCGLGHREFELVTLD